jgi:uncharacterized protein YndB with AHSA1/START domain
MEQGFTYSKSTAIHAPIAKVWSVLTDPELIPRYYFGMEWKTDWKKGSPILFRGDYDHQPFEDKGFILDIEPEKFIHFSYFNPSRGEPDVPENYTSIRFELSTDSTGTIFTVYQYGFKSEAEFQMVITKWDAVLYDVKKLTEQEN